MRRAARTDSNQQAIVQALRAVGALPYYIKEPCDLIVGYRGKNTLLEIKNRDGKDQLTKAQVEFIATWPGQIEVVYTVEEALKAVIGEYK
jgi:hypothetical protein